ncbi:heavy-metal-associated domain-containing protein [Salinicola acroporae]|uniref:Uncharacterized protein n=1 Tax=Salinicola acroporae TaxID=1541440 RepID=A0ABT6I661_9GAMM|nr:hypothetical protein [Salinicola acroporae]MDH4573212.1 hypothetical protein [Salinicola acroporae]
MPHINLTLSGVSTPEDLNRVTTALMMVDGVESVDIGREWAEVEGRASRDALIAAVEALKSGFSAR